MGKIKKSIILPKNSIVLFFFFLLVFLGNKTPIYEKQTGERSLLNRDDAKNEIIDKENVTKPSAESFEWTVEKVDEHLTKIKLPPDDHMSTEDELFDAMNSYRKAQGVQQVQKNDTICRIAHVRAEEQNSNGELDGHAGFDKYVQEQKSAMELWVRRGCRILCSFCFWKKVIDRKLIREYIATQWLI
ncbi:MAG: hypothetical protein HYT09_00070 [Candidatus Levybacteria bacterium]|nr:hypothetical protein [Candidatus Levybacteria bacterium]